jgi:hypothetical protein
VLFMIGDTEYCPRTSTDVFWNEGMLDFRVFGWGSVVVKRYLHKGHTANSWYGNTAMAA